MGSAFYFTQGVGNPKKKDGIDDGIHSHIHSPHS